MTKRVVPNVVIIIDIKKKIMKIHVFLKMKLKVIITIIIIIALKKLN